MYKFILSQHNAFHYAFPEEVSQKKNRLKIVIYIVSYKIYEYNKDAVCGKDIKDFDKDLIFQTYNGILQSNFYVRAL